MTAVDINALVNAFVTFFVIIDPVGLVPIFLALTSGLPADRRRAIGGRAVVISAVILGAFMIFGHSLLAIFGIGLPAFRIAGGLLLMAIAFEMTFAKRGPRRSSHADAAKHEREGDDVSVFPLSIPLICGPGAITSALLLVGDAKGDPLEIAGIAAMAAAVLAICYVLFLMAGAAERLLGETVVTVITRLLGVLLAALAVQFVIDGVRQAFNL